MPKPIDMLAGFAPVREITENEDGTFTVKVTPPVFMQSRGSSVTLTADQFARYKKWRDTGILIQDALPELSAPQREMLMSGLSNDEFHQAAGSEPCPDCSGTGGLYSSQGGVVLDKACATCGGTGFIEPEECEVIEPEDQSQGDVLGIYDERNEP